jgi:hypothetical protein
MYAVEYCPCWIPLARVELIHTLGPQYPLTTPIRVVPPVKPVVSSLSVMYRTPWLVVPWGAKATQPTLFMMARLGSMRVPPASMKPLMEPIITSLKAKEVEGRVVPFTKVKLMGAVKVARLNPALLFMTIMR